MDSDQQAAALAFSGLQTHVSWWSAARPIQGRRRPGV